jgi:membrane-anchored glycerophosphoryl diester phosphodiesterase (GDPDase)
MSELNGDTHMNKMMRNFRSDYVEDALLVTLVIIIVVALYLAAVYLLILT